MPLRTLVSLVCLVLTIACVSAPAPTAGALRTLRNPSAVVEGHVHDLDGRPVAGIEVQGLPRAADLPWSPAAKTDAQGRFLLRLYAPGEYGFVLSKNGITVVTADPRDPSRQQIGVQPGERRTGIELVFLADGWARVTAGD